MKDTVTFDWIFKDVVGKCLNVVSRETTYDAWTIWDVSITLASIFITSRYLVYKIFQGEFTSQHRTLCGRFEQKSNVHGWLALRPFVPPDYLHLLHESVYIRSARDNLLKNKQQNFEHFLPLKWLPISVNSLYLSDGIWRHRSESTLAQVIACCLTTTNHYLIRCWLLISYVPFHSPESNFSNTASEKYAYKIIVVSLMSQCVNTMCTMLL